MDNESLINSSEIIACDDEIIDLNNWLKAKESFIKKWGYDPQDNYRYRTVIATYLLNKHVDKTLKYYEFRTGSDFLNSRGLKGECKSSGCLTRYTKSGKFKKDGGYYKKQGIFPFCKQDEEVRRTEILTYNSFIFAAFDKEDQSKVVCVIYLNTPNSVNSFFEILKPKQDEFVKYFEDCKTKKKPMGWDAINISIQEISNINEAIIIDGTGNIIDKSTLYDTILKWK